MRNYLRGPFKRAVETSTTTLGDVAEGVGRSYRTLQKYLRNELRVTPAASRRLVRYLRKRARVLDRAADQLEAALEREERGQK